MIKLRFVIFKLPAPLRIYIKLTKSKQKIKPIFLNENKINPWWDIIWRTLTKLKSQH